MDPSTESLPLNIADWLPAFTHSASGELHAANEAFLQLIGYSVAELAENRFVAASALRALSNPSTPTTAAARSLTSFRVCHTELQHREGFLIPVLYAARELSPALFECVCFDLTTTFIKPPQKTLASSLQDRTDDQSRSIARKLHDTTAQNLAALAMNLSLITPVSATPERAASAIQECARLTSDSLAEVRRISYLLYPPLLDELGLDAALRTFTQMFERETGIPVEVQIPPSLTRLPAKVEIHLVRVVQERLSYLAEHSDATGCNISISETDAGLEVRICDDAHSETEMPPDTMEHYTLSLALMRERARQIGSSLSVELGPKGTTIRAIIARS